MTNPALPHGLDRGLPFLRRFAGDSRHSCRGKGASLLGKSHIRQMTGDSIENLLQLWVSHKRKTP
jgi:hypothetical protein